MKLSAQPIWQPDVYVLDRKLHVREEHEDEIKDNDTEDNIQLSMASLHQLSSLETVTLAAEIHLLGQLRDRLSPAARYAEKIQSKYRKTGSHTETEAEQAEYLYEGFPFVERGKPLTGLLVIDRYSTVEFESENNEVSAAGQYTGERLYLTYDRKWILAERVGAYSGARGSASEWESTCRIVTDRTLLEHYSMNIITDGLFEATNKLWARLSPRLDALKHRAEKTQQVSGKLARLRSSPPARLGAETKKPTENNSDNAENAVTQLGKALFRRK